MQEAAFSLVQTPVGFQQALLLFTAGALSKGLGEAGILLINRVSKAQFVRSLVVSGLLLALTGLIWSGCIWLSCRYAMGLTFDFQQVAKVVLLSYTPFILGFLVIIPHVGLLWQRLLMVWGLLITLAGLHFQFHLTLLQGIACSGVGWLAFYLLNYLFGGFTEKIRLRLLGRDQWVKPKEAAVALLRKELNR